MASGTYAFGEFSLDLGDRRLRRAGEPVELSSRYFDALLKKQAPRFRKHGLRPLFALGIAPRAAPRRGLEEALHDLPAFLSHPATVAMGALSLREMNERESSVLTRQLEIAAELRRPVIVAAPTTQPARHTRTLLRWLRDSPLTPDRILIENLTARSAGLALGYGFAASLEVSTGRLSTSDVVSLVRSSGPRSLVLTSHAGEGAANLLAIPLVVERLREAGLSRAVIQRLAVDNALRFLGRYEPRRAGA